MARTLRFAHTCVMLIVVASAPACGRGPTAPPLAQPAPLPPGVSWQGVYTSATHGEIHLLVTDGRADAVYRTPEGVLGKWWGAVDGDQIRFVWREQRRNEHGHRIPWFGRGYLVYKPGAGGRPDSLEGEWGLEYSESGQPLNALKRPGLSPDIWTTRVNGEESDEDGDEYEELEDDDFDDE